MKTLFNKYEMYNENGRELSHEIYPFIKETIEKWRALGYKSNEIVRIIHDEISLTDSEIRIMNSITMHKNERNNK